MTDILAMRRKAESQGWRVEYTGAGHLKWIPPTPGRPIIISSSTTSDYRSIRKHRSLMRQSGFQE